MTDHVLLAVEPAWVTQEYQPDGNGSYEPRGPSSVEEFIDSMESSCSYDCECGESFDDWNAATDHLSEVQG